MVSKFLGRDIVQKPHCPFCGMGIDPPKELDTRMPHEMPLGRCSCGAVYAFDVTGHNLGTAMIDALVFGCNGDWDLAWGLLPEEDYLVKEVENYDVESHKIIPGGAYEGRRISGSLFFIRLHEDVREVTDEGAKHRLEQARPAAGKTSKKRGGKKTFSKKEVEVLVQSYELDPLIQIAERDKRIIRDLQRLIYSADKLQRWRATDALGKVSAIIAEYDPGAISKLLQTLLTAVADTAASSWGCIDAVGEIISQKPDQFAGYASQLYRYASDRELLVEVLRALGKIGGASPGLLRKRAFYFIPLLQDPDPEVRAYAAILLGNLGSSEAAEDLEELKADHVPVEIYRDGSIEELTIGQLASEALEKL
jgi:HEAT repeat protein